MLYILSDQNIVFKCNTHVTNISREFFFQYSLKFSIHKNIIIFIYRRQLFS